MTAEKSKEPVLPEHVEATIQAMARVHLGHHQSASPLQRLIEKITGIFGSLKFICFLTILILGWIGANILLWHNGYIAPDPPPFHWLESIISLTALYVAIFILSTQQRESRLTEQREQLTLELSILSEQKSAKIIQLLEAFRRDNPNITHRQDVEADAMSRPSDPESVLDAIKETHAQPTTAPKT